MPDFQRRHYKQVAEILKTIDVQSVKERAVRAFSNLFAYDNPNFDEERFRKACGL